MGRWTTSDAWDVSHEINRIGMPRHGRSGCRRGEAWLPAMARCAPGLNRIPGASTAPALTVIDMAECITLTGGTISFKTRDAAGCSCPQPASCGLISPAMLMITRKNEAHSLAIIAQAARLEWQAALVAPGESTVSIIPRHEYSAYRRKILAEDRGGESPAL